MFLRGRGRVKVLIQPLCHRGSQGEMELDLLAIQGAPFGRVEVRLFLFVYRAKLYSAILNTIFITRTAIFRRYS